MNEPQPLISPIQIQMMGPMNCESGIGAGPGTHDPTHCEPFSVQGQPPVGIIDLQSHLLIENLQRRQTYNEKLSTAHIL